MKLKHQSEGHLTSKESYVNSKGKERNTHELSPPHSPSCSVQFGPSSCLNSLPSHGLQHVFLEEPCSLMFLSCRRTGKQKCCQVSFSENPEADRETSGCSLGQKTVLISCDVGHTSFHHL